MLFSVQYEYFNAVLINEVDEDGNSVELGGEFMLEPNDHFNNLSVNLSLSVVQVPTNMYNKGDASFTWVYRIWGSVLDLIALPFISMAVVWKYTNCTVPVLHL